MADRKQAGKNGRSAGARKQRKGSSGSSSGKTQQSLRNRITGEADLQKADKILKSMLRREKPVTEDSFNKVRNIIRAQKTKVTRLFWLSAVLAVLLIITLLASLIGSVVRRGQSGAGEAVKAAEASESTDMEASSVEASSEEAPLVTPTPAPLAAPVDITLGVTGDIIFGPTEDVAQLSYFQQTYNLYGAEYFLQNVKELLADDDLTITDLNTALSDQKATRASSSSYNAATEYVKIFENASVEAVDVANPHTMDCGEGGYEDTVNTLNANGMKAFGEGLYATWQKDGMQIGLAGINDPDEDLIREAVDGLKAEGTNLIVLAFYWAEDSGETPSADQIRMAHAAVDAGAHIIIGYGSEVMQGVEFYRNCPIVYSLGYFCYGGESYPTEYDTVVLRIKATVDENRNYKTAELTAIPCSISSDETYNTYQPTPLTGDRADLTLGTLEIRSEAILDAEETAGIDTSEMQIYDPTPGKEPVTSLGGEDAALMDDGTGEGV